VLILTSLGYPGRTVKRPCTWRTYFDGIQDLAAKWILPEQTAKPGSRLGKKKGVTS